ncbi:hypothetical protein MNBD_PLANCTO03-1938, partial [hydrothermal vent metagenome]
GDVPPPPEDERAGLALTGGEALAPDPAMLFTNDWDRALALLAEGRLLVRVQSADPTRTIAQLGRFTDRATRPGEAWRLETEVAEPIAVAMETRFAPVVLPDDSRNKPLAFAADEGVGEARESLSMAQLQQQHKVAPSSPLEAVYMADTRLDRAAMASLRSALSLGNGQVAVFEELASPIELPRVLTPDAVLWWGRPVREWSARVYVPIVVERMDE